MEYICALQGIADASEAVTNKARGIAAFMGSNEVAKGDPTSPIFLFVPVFFGNPPFGGSGCRESLSDLFRVVDAPPQPPPPAAGRDRVRRKDWAWTESCADSALHLA